MELVIDAAGDALRFFEANAAALGIDDPDSVGPDPVLLWLRCVEAGFADGDHGLAPRLALLDSCFDAAHAQQSWRVEAQNLDRGQLLIVRNLLQARDARQVIVRAALDPAPLPLDTLEFPAVTPAAGVQWDWSPPDPDDIVRHRELRMVLAEAHNPALARQLCADLDRWTEVVCRSGYCPPDAEPTNAGAMPAFAYALDSHTLAVDFDGIFRVDEACFDAIASYTRRLHSRGVAVASVSVR